MAELLQKSSCCIFVAMLQFPSARVIVLSARNHMIYPVWTSAYFFTFGLSACVEWLCHIWGWNWRLACPSGFLTVCPYTGLHYLNGTRALWGPSIVDEFCGHREQSITEQFNIYEILCIFIFLVSAEKNDFFSFFSPYAKAMQSISKHINVNHRALPLVQPCLTSKCMNCNITVHYQVLSSGVRNKYFIYWWSFRTEILVVGGFYLPQSHSLAHTSTAHTFG